MCMNVRAHIHAHVRRLSLNSYLPEIALTVGVAVIMPAPPIVFGFNVLSIAAWSPPPLPFFQPAARLKTTKTKIKIKIEKKD